MSLKEIFCEARSCQRCYPGKEIYVPLPDPKNSDGKAEIIFINERPGRIGTGQSGYISFDNEDPSALFFKECFEATGLDRKKVAITNACLCHPVFEGYTDTKPNPKELRNCHYWLQKQIEETNPLLIVTLGRTAYESTMRHFKHWPNPNGSKLSDVVGTIIRTTTPWIYPLYHTSRLGRANREATLQKQDWLAIPSIINEIRDAK